MVRITRRNTLALMGSGIAASAMAGPAIAQNSKIKVGALRFTSHSGSFIALERGYFADAGLDVELEFFQAAQPMAVAIASGDIDYAVTAISGGLISLAEKGAIKVIGGALTEEQGIDGQQILASDSAYKAGLTSPSMLDGKSYGVTQSGSSFHYVGSKIAQAEGVQMTFKPLQKVGAVIGALRSGQIDAWNIVPHIAKPLAASGAVHIIGAVQDYIPNYMITTVFTSTDNASNQRSLTESFLSAFSRGVDDYNSTMIDMASGQAGVDNMVDLIHKYVYTDRPRDKAAPPIISGTMRLSPNAALNAASVRDQLAWFQSEGLVDESITFNTLVDDSYVEIMS